VRKAARLPPAEAMRPEPPASYKPTLLERIGLGVLVPNVARMILRDGLFIGFTELRILARLYEGSAASISDLSRDLLIDKAWISRQLRQLARRGLIVKGPHPSDSRVTLASLTPLARDRRAYVLI
jgi:DNA-binding MarR family transcriptional regulator